MDLPVLPSKIPRLALRKETGSTMEANGTNSSSDIIGLKVLNEIHSISQGKKESTKKRRLKAELHNSEEKKTGSRIITKTNLEQKKRRKPVVSLMFEEDELGCSLKDSLEINKPSNPPIFLYRTVLGEAEQENLYLEGTWRFWAKIAFFPG